jgi:hypothetical protein
MAVCRKCNTANEEGLTRCKSCNAIMPVKIGSKSEQRWERTRRAPDLVGMECPSCGATNPYTRFKCSACGALLRREPKRAGVLGKVVIAIGIALVVLVTVLSMTMRGAEERTTEVQSTTGAYAEEGGYPEAVAPEPQQPYERRSRGRGRRGRR